MNLHESPSLFEQYIRLSAEYFGMVDTFIEKDYWLTSLLRNLSQHEYRDLFVFKGGTSLSKAYGMIERFSEDVDLALLMNGLSGNQGKTRIDRVSKNISVHLTEVTMQGQTKKWSRFRRTFHKYPAVIAPVPGTQMEPLLCLEMNAFAVPHPHENVEMQSFIAEFLRFKGQEELCATYGLKPFSIQVLKPERTLAEKILALVRASYHETPILQLQNKIRHAYDLHIMMQQQHLGAFVASDEFFTMIDAAQHDDLNSQEFTGDWHNSALSSSLFFQDKDEVWEQLQQTYEGPFARLVYGELPQLSDIRKSIRVLNSRLIRFDHAFRS